MSSSRYFSSKTIRFLKDLSANNTRDWFQANKQRYEDEVREPALQFIRDFEPHLESISPHFRADDRKVGGSLFRIHRDVRFSKDKSPYKTHTGVHFRHAAAKDAHAPGFYLHLQPRQFFAGVGIWRPDGESLLKIRTAIAENADEWTAARDDPDFAARWELSGDSLVRAPKGFSPDHPLLEDLKRKDFIGVANLTQKEVTSGGFIEEFAARCRAGSSLAAFLCRALGVGF